MRREGRQHGMVRYFETWPVQYKEGAKTRIVRKFSGPPTTDIDTKVPSKPTNHSKYTSRCTHRPRCGGCHLHPVCRSKDKTKGTHKLNSRDVVLNHQLVSWRAGELNFAGISASWVLDHLLSECLDYEEEDQGDDMFESSCVEEEIEVGSGDTFGTGFDDRDDDFGFSHVWLVWDRVDSDEDWCVVGEL